MIPTPPPPTPLLQWVLRGAFWLTALVMPGGVLLALLPWLRRYVQKHKDAAPCEGC